jgi:hypothetical protein
LQYQIWGSEFLVVRSDFIEFLPNFCSPPQPHPPAQDRHSASNRGRKKIFNRPAVWSAVQNLRIFVVSSRRQINRDMFGLWWGFDISKLPIL